MAVTVLVVALFLGVGCLADSGTYHDLESIHDEIMAGYNRDVLPKAEPNVGVNVSVDFTLIQLDEVELDDGEVSVVVWVGHSWDDPRLRWNKDLHHGIDKLAFPFEKIWRPDLALYNSVREPERLNENKIIVRSSGRVFYVPALRMRASCPIVAESKNVTCGFRVGSWVHDDSNIDVYPSDHMEVSTLYTNPKWSAEFLGGERQVKKYDCCEGNYPSVVFTVRFVRK